MSSLKGKERYPSKKVGQKPRPFEDFQGGGAFPRKGLLSEGISGVPSQRVISPGWPKLTSFCRAGPNLSWLNPKFGHLRRLIPGVPKLFGQIFKGIGAELEVLIIPPHSSNNLLTLRIRGITPQFDFTSTKGGGQKGLILGAWII